MREELEILAKEQELISAMEKSCVEAQKKFQEKAQEFMFKHFNVKKGEVVSIFDLLSRATK